MLVEFIENRSGLRNQIIKNCLQLFEGGATVPFIARYRKDLINNLPETSIFQIQDLAELFKKIEKRRNVILESIEGQGKLSPQLKSLIANTWELGELETIYSPYKLKKKSRADLAKEAGLEPLAKMIMAQNQRDIISTARKFISEAFSQIDQVIEGAKDIIASWMAEDIKTRKILKEQCLKFGVIVSTVKNSKKSEAAGYQDYWNYQEKGHKIAAHRLLAILRGQKEGFLRVKLVYNQCRFLENLKNLKIKKNSQTKQWINEAIEDAYNRLLFPSIESQVMGEWANKAEDEAIDIFKKNLSQLLLSPPVRNQSVMAIDPGFRTGCKVVCLDANGQFQDHTTIYPHEPQLQKHQAFQQLKDLLKKYDISHLAIGSGTAGRETYDWLSTQLDQNKFQLYLVNEDGASIYSASDIARKEFPTLDLTIRGAISIGRRLQDPLSELVKIDPKSLGIGQYQHDVNQVKLKNALDQVVMSCVNQVGIDLNTASPHVLQFIAGLGPKLAQNIVDFRSEIGRFEDRTQLLQVPRMGEKVFIQAVGFLRIRDGNNPLDNTGVHPESYIIVKKMADQLGIKTKELIRNEEYLALIDPRKYLSKEIGLLSIQDILEELKKPGHDPRGEARAVKFNKDIKKLEDLDIGMIVNGIVNNMTKFGAFVNIGLKTDALIHISEITDEFIENPAEILTIGQQVKARIKSIDLSRKRINLSLKNVGNKDAS